MTNQWKDRIIRGGAIAVMTVAALGCMVWLTSIMAGYPGALRAGGIILAAAACIGCERFATAHRTHLSILSVTDLSRCKGLRYPPAGTKQNGQSSKSATGTNDLGGFASS